jgi:hypothetical protein
MVSYRVLRDVSGLWVVHPTATLKTNNVTKKDPHWEILLLPLRMAFSRLMAAPGHIRAQTFILPP